MRLTRWTVPLAAAVVVAAVVVTAAWLASGGGSGPRAPHVLHLRAGGQQVAAMSAATSTATDTEPAGAQQPYRLVGSLPDTKPDDRPVWRPRTATGDAARSVAEALGLPGAPMRVAGGWALRDGTNRLVVRDAGSWSYGMDCAPDQPVSSTDVTVMCAASSGVAVSAPAEGTPTSPAPEPMPTLPPGPTDATARAVALPVFAALGLDPGDVVVYAGDPMSTVQISPRVGDVATTNWVTSVQVDAGADIVSADGWLGEPRQGDTYPLISAARAFDLLQQQPRPMMELCAQRPDGKPGCADVPPTEVTGATLGLSLDYDGAHAVLVPAWLFAVKGQQEPLTQIAVDPSYLAPPPTPDADPGVMTR